MPQRSKGPRLYLQKPRPAREGKAAEPAVYVIRDGNTKRSTGAGKSEIARAEEALRTYLNQKPAPRSGNRDPSAVQVATVIAIYTEDVVQKHARPGETAGRLDNILDFFGQDMLDTVNQDRCEAYVRYRGEAPVARRELEDFRSAIRHHWKRGMCTALTPVVLPQRGEARERWLTRQEAARLLWAAWRMRQAWHGRDSERSTGKHVARFILAGLYTGTRASAICGSALRPGVEGSSGWIDTVNGVFYRRHLGSRRTKKRQPFVRMPPRLLAHVRRWIERRAILNYLIEWQGEPVKRVNKAFRAAAKAAGLGRDVTPHILRHTAITWQAQVGVPPHEICGFFGITLEVFEQVYGHHHPDFQANAVNALNRNRARSGTVSMLKAVG